MEDDSVGARAPDWYAPAAHTLTEALLPTTCVVVNKPPALKHFPTIGAAPQLSESRSRVPRNHRSGIPLRGPCLRRGRLQPGERHSPSSAGLTRVGVFPYGLLGRCSSLVRFLERRTPLPVEGGTSRVSVGGVKAGIAVWQLKTYPDPGSNALADFCRTSSEEGKPCSREIQPIWSKSRCVGLRSGAGRGRLLRLIRSLKLCCPRPASWSTNLQRYNTFRQPGLRPACQKVVHAYREIAAVPSRSAALLSEIQTGLVTRACRIHSSPRPR